MKDIFRVSGRGQTPKGPAPEVIIVVLMGIAALLFGAYMLFGNKSSAAAPAAENEELYTETYESESVTAIEEPVHDSTEPAVETPESTERTGTVYVDPNAKYNRIKVRESPGLNGTDTKARKYSGDRVTVYEETTADGYTWYRIGEKQYIADNGKSFGVRFD